MEQLGGGWSWPCGRGNNRGLEMVVLVDGVVVVVVVVPEEEVVVVATRSHEGHIVRVVAGSCM